MLTTMFAVRICILGTGRLEPGERIVCKFVFEASLVPQLFEGEVRCNITVDAEGIYAAIAAMEVSATTVYKSVVHLLML